MVGQLAERQCQQCHVCVCEPMGCQEGVVRTWSMVKADLRSACRQRLPSDSSCPPDAPGRPAAASQVRGTQTVSLQRMIARVRHASRE
jgi:hypothetical protein